MLKKLLYFMKTIENGDKMLDSTSSLEQTPSRRSITLAAKCTGSGKKKVVKKLRLDATNHVFQSNDFDEQNPFEKGNAKDEVELRFDEGKCLYVSETFLCYTSPVFTRMFQSGFKERASKAVELQDKSFEFFFDMLLYLHPRVQKEISYPGAMVIYQIAHEYQIPTVLKKAETVLTEHIASQKYAAKDCISASEYNQTFLHKAFKMLNFAQGYGINALMAASAERLSAFPMETFTKHPSYMGLPESIKNRILMYRLKRFDRCAVQDKLVKLD